MGLSRLPWDRSDRDSSGGWVMAVIDPNRSLVAGNRDGEKCSRAIIEPGTASDGIRGSCRSLMRFGYQRCAKRDVTGHIIMADGSYRTV